MLKKSKTTQAFTFMKKGLTDLNKLQTKVGWFESSRYNDANKTSVAYVAAIMEEGYAAGSIPPRPFIVPAITENAVEWRQIMAKGASNILKGSATAFEVMESIGLNAEGAVKRKISEVTTPPLADSTLAARRRKGKKSIKPLVDTGYLIGTLSSVTK